MPSLASCLTPARSLLLRAASRRECIEELVGAISRDVPALDRDAVLEAVQLREQDVDTALSPGVALPHARLPGLGRPILAAGLHRRGVEWGSAHGPVHLVLLVLGDQEQSDVHIELLSEIAEVVEETGRLEAIRASTSASELFLQLLSDAAHTGAPHGRARAVRSAALVSHAVELMTQVGATTTIVYVDEQVDVEHIALRPAQGTLILATSAPRRHARFADRFAAVLNVPARGLGVRHRVDLGLLLAVTQGLIGRDHAVVCVHGDHGTGALDGVSVIDVAAELGGLMGLHPELIDGSIAHRVLHRVLDIAVSLAMEGREGHPVGTMFVLGDHEAVLEHCHQIVINPFKGYPEEERNILDPSLEETVKEFAWLDGAFVIRRDGVILTAGTRVAVGRHPYELPSGLGTRHAAGIGISGITSALTVVISESTGNVTLFMGGKMVLTLRRGAR